MGSDLGEPGASALEEEDFEMIRVGTIVRLKGTTETAKVRLFYDDIPGGVKLDRELEGFYSWNVADLERAPSTSSEPASGSPK